MKAKALVLAEMNAFMQKRTEEDEKVNRELEQTLQALQRYLEFNRFGGGPGPCLGAAWKNHHQTSFNP